MAESISDERRQAILQAEIAKLVRDGYSVQSTTGTQAILTRNKKIGLVGNIILTLITGFLWLVVIAYRIVNRKGHTVIVSVDAFGNVQRS